MKIKEKTDGVSGEMREAGERKARGSSLINFVRRMHRPAAVKGISENENEENIRVDGWMD